MIARPQLASTITPATTFRLLENGEREPLVEVFAGMSAQSRHLRFLYPVPRLTEQMLRVLTDVDGVRKVALGAFADDKCVAIARFSRSPQHPHEADLAVAVVDAMQRRGVGRRAMTVLAGIAAELGITTFAVTVHPDNHGSLALLRSYSAQLRLIDRIHEGQVAVSAILEHAAAGRLSARRGPAPALRPEPTSWPAPRPRYCLP